MSGYPMPYGYQPQPMQNPQYPQYPYDPRLERLQALDSRMKEMEARLYGNSNNFQQPQNAPPQSYSGNNNPGNTQSNTQGIQIIAVQSEEEAFKDPPNIDGSKSIYYNEKADVFYTKLFDANVPKTYRNVYKKVVEDEVTEQQPKSTPESNITPAITALSEKVAAIEESINGMMDEFDEISTYIRKLTVAEKRNKVGRPVKKEESENAE